MSQIYSLIKYTATLVGHCKQFLCGALRDLVPFAQFRKRQKHTWRSVTLVNCRLKPVTLLKVTLLRGYPLPWSYNALVLY